MAISHNIHEIYTPNSPPKNLEGAL